MLAHQKALAGFQFHIEGIIAGAGTFSVHVLALDGIFPVYRGHGASPGLIVKPAVYDHGLSFGDIIDILLVDGSLDPEVACLHDHDEAVLGLVAAVAAVIRLGAAVFIDALNNAFHVAGDCGMGYIVPDPVKFQFFALDIVLLLLEVELLLLDLDCIVGLVSAGGRLFLFLQLLNGGLYAVQFVLLSLQFDLALGQVFFILGIVIGKKRGSFLDFIACLHEDLLNFGIVPLVERLCLLGLYRACVSVENTVGGILAGQGGHRRNIGHVLSVASVCTLSSSEIEKS